MSAADEVAAKEMIFSIGVVAGMFSTTPQTVRDWVKAGMPQASHGKYRLADCIQDHGP